MEIQNESARLGLKNETVNIILKYLRLCRSSYPDNKNKKPEETAGEKDADEWINSRMKEIVENVFEFGRKSDYPLLTAAYHVLKTCMDDNEKSFQTHTIPHNATKSIMQQLCETVYGEHEMDFRMEESIMEEILTLGEKHGLIIDKRRPEILPDGSVRMGFKYNKPALENKLTEIVKEKLRAIIKELGEPFISLSKKSSTELYHVNKDPKGGWDFSDCV